MGAPVTIVAQGSPITPGKQGVPVTLVDSTGHPVSVLPAGSVAVKQDDPMSVRTAVGTDPHAGTVQVSGSVATVNLTGNVAMVDFNDVVSVRNSAGADPHNATAVVTGTGTLSGVNLAANTILVDNGDAVTITNSLGGNAQAGILSVSGTVLQGAVLPATAAIVPSTVKIIMPQITGTYTNGYTFTVAGGVITAGVAS